MASLENQHFHVLVISIYLSLCTQRCSTLTGNEGRCKCWNGPRGGEEGDEDVDGSVDLHFCRRGVIVKCSNLICEKEFEL
jgi:hypothetical protein